MQDEERQRANLRLLQRHGYTHLHTLHATATHCVLYTFQDTAWTKAGTEGALCVADSPLTLVILNRNAAEPFSLVLQTATGSQTTLQKEQGYLIVRDSSGIYGLWFPDPQELDRMYTIVQQRLRSVSAPPRSVPAAEALKAALGIGGTSEEETPAESTPQPPLDKRCLQLALLSLLQDERFLELLHAQYVKILQRKQDGKPP